MTSGTARVLIFEDDDDAFNKLVTSLAPRLRAMQAEPERFKAQGSERAEKEVESAIQRQPPASLVVLDWDLTKYIDTAVSRQLVRGTTEELCVPLCTYTSPKGDHGELQRMMRWQDDVIPIDSSDDYDEIARKSAAVAGGFLALERLRAQESSSLSRWIAAALHAPEAAQAQVAEYAMADLQRLLQVADPGPTDRTRLAVTTVGYWIHNQLLQFPGVLLNAVAAASYLDIDPGQFTGDVRTLFDRAKYKGPFAELADYWWIAELDAICGEQMRDADRTMLSGRAAADRMLNRTLRAARCSAGHDGAGYYCLITKKAVCAEHSVRPGTWLPLGADRSRIEKAKYEELSAWLPE